MHRAFKLDPNSSKESDSSLYFDVVPICRCLPILLHPPFGHSTLPLPPHSYARRLGPRGTEASCRATLGGCSTGCNWHRRRRAWRSRLRGSLGRTSGGALGPGQRTPGWRGSRSWGRSSRSRRDAHGRGPRRASSAAAVGAELACHAPSLCFSLPLSARSGCRAHADTGPTLLLLRGWSRGAAGVELRRSSGERQGS
jgi:hypothetical protein